MADNDTLWIRLNSEDFEEVVTALQHIGNSLDEVAHAVGHVGESIKDASFTGNSAEVGQVSDSLDLLASAVKSLRPAEGEG